MGNRHIRRRRSNRALHAAPLSAREVLDLMPASAPKRLLPSRRTRALGPLAWLIIALAAGTHVVLGATSAGTSQLILLGSLGVFFLILMLRLALAAALDPARRGRVLVLLASVLLWAGGSVVVNARPHADLTRFPAPGESFFVMAYVLMAAYLLLDAGRRSQRGAAVWLDVSVVCGGSACLAGVVLLFPAAGGFGQRGPALLLALLYPLVDLALALLVLAQIMLRARSDIRHATKIIVGFLCFAFADAHIVTNFSDGTYRFSALDDVAWGVAFALIVGSACRPADALRRAVPRPMGSVVVLLAAAIAMIVLVIRPADHLGPYLVAISALTLIAAGGRLALALKQARGAAEAVKLARTDDLTGLPNRRAIRVTIERGIRSDAPLGLILLDLDGFKEINDTLGHLAGDTVLQLTAIELREAVPPDMMVARLGGDEFAVVIESSDEILLAETAARIQRELSKPLLVEGIELSPRASIGVAARTATSQYDTGELLRRADVAMYQAKVNRAAPVLYDPGNDDFSRSRLQLAEELRKGIPAGQLRLLYQPQIDTAATSVCAVEALVRWDHPTQGLLSPISFLPAARRAGLMSLLSEEVARIAVTDLAGWLATGLDLRVAVNCAPPELLSGVFLDRLSSLLEQFPGCADHLVVELTEDSFLTDPERARELINGMRERQLQIAIDDYGTGFSSLAYLRDLPVQELKIDRSFIAGVITDTRTRMIVSSTIQMASALDLRTVAEGVEDEATAAHLIAMGVDVLQGYHFARPMAAAELEGWIRQWDAEHENTTGGPAGGLEIRRDIRRSKAGPARTARTMRHATGL